MSLLEDRRLKELEFHNIDRDLNREKDSQANETYEKFYGKKILFYTCKIQKL